MNACPESNFISNQFVSNLQVKFIETKERPLSSVFCVRKHITQLTLSLFQLENWCYRAQGRWACFLYPQQAYISYTNDCVPVVMVLKPHRASKRDVTPHGRQSKITSMCWVPLADLPGCTEPQCDHRALSGHKPRKAQDCSAKGARPVLPVREAQPGLLSDSRRPHLPFDRCVLKFMKSFSSQATGCREEWWMPRVLTFITALPAYLSCRVWFEKRYV